MYKSVIEIVCSQMRLDLENEMLKAVQEYNIVVDKDELIKALNYDRNQYKEGYNDACKEFAERLKEKAQPYEVITAYAEDEIKAIEIEEIDNIVKEMEK